MQHLIEILPFSKKYIFSKIDTFKSDKKIKERKTYLNDGVLGYPAAYQGQQGPSRPPVPSESFHRDSLSMLAKKLFQII